MESHVLHAGAVFMGLFAIMNPFANTPVFLSLTADDDPGTRRAIALRSVSLTFVIVLIFCLAGRTIFELFGITLPAFRITGGILVFLIGFQMLHGEQSRVHQPSSEDVEGSRDASLSIAVSPLAVPILAGPGTIATAMSFVAGGSTLRLLNTIGSFAVLCAMTYALFVSGERLVKYIGASALNVITRMMGLILAVIGTQMVISGIQGAFKHFG